MIMGTASYERSNLRWNGWGARGESFPFGEREPAIWAWIEALLGEGALPVSEPVTLDTIALPASRVEAELAQGPPPPTELKTDRYERIFHSCGRSFCDLVRLRMGAIEHFTDAVAYPRSDDDVARLMRWCEERGYALVPFGGGSSVVGGVTPLRGERRGVVTLDTTKLNALIAVDPEAHTATAQAGMYGPELEAALQERGFTLGHYPQSFRYSTLGGWIAARGAGQQSAGYGVAARWLVAAKVVGPAGTLQTGDHPNSAAGPDLSQWIAGSEGTLGVITEATVRVTPVPASKNYQGLLFPTFEAGTRVVRAMVQAGLPLSMLRLSDGDETHFLGTFSQVGRAQSAASRLQDRALQALRFGESKALLLIGAEGSSAHTTRVMTRALAICARHGALPLGKKMGERWYGGRFTMPYLREPMMDRGIGVETLETAVPWSKLPTLHRALRAAIEEAATEASGTRCVVMAHISHTYTTGASLYFTFVWRLRGGERRGDIEGERRAAEVALEQWAAIKKAASAAIQAGGGTISHHHGVGADHLPWMAEEKGGLGVEALAAARRAMDPTLMMNPGKLLPGG